MTIRSVFTIVFLIVVPAMIFGCADHTRAVLAYQECESICKTAGAQLDYVGSSSGNCYCIKRKAIIK